MWLILLILTAATGGQPYLAACGRSPIPEPGEKITKPLPFVRLAPDQDAPQAKRAAEPAQVIPWTQAHLYVDQTVTIEGTIVDTHRLSNLTFLNFDKQWQSKFYVVVFTKAHDADFHPETEYLNKKVRVTGKVVLHKNRPQIQVHYINQIEVVP